MHRDHREFFSETWGNAGLSALGVNLRFVEDYDSRPLKRGLHFRIPPTTWSKTGANKLRGLSETVMVMIQEAAR
ncbi:MAG: hypothetical protein DMG50_05795 [Acidobacteria bacterium]|nr:MAG: hypothetical protein DMG50_05795 [Acidobacteriota bacterium]